MRRLAAVVALFGVAACTVETDPAPRGGTTIVETEPTYPPASASTLVVNWTIDGRADPDACVQAVASQIEIAVLDRAGNEVGVWRQRCDAFATTIPLGAGSYDAGATLLDGAAQARTTTVIIDAFSLSGNETFDVAVDFPASSFR